MTIEAGRLSVLDLLAETQIVFSASGVISCNRGISGRKESFCHRY